MQGLQLELSHECGVGGRERSRAGGGRWAWTPPETFGGRRDSGAGVALLDAATAQALGVDAAGPDPDLHTGGGPMTSSASAPVTVTLPNHTTLRPTPVQTDLAPVSKMLHRRIDLVLGADVLRSAALFIFPGEHTLVFEPPRTRPAGFHRVPLSVHGRAAIVPVEADGHAFSAVLDLGSSRMAVSLGGFTMLATKRATDGVTAGASRRITMVPVARLGTLAIGGEAEADVPYQTSSLPSLFTADADSVIGSEELVPFNVGIDLADGALWPAYPPDRRPSGGGGVHSVEAWPGGRTGEKRRLRRAKTLVLERFFELDSALRGAELLPPSSRSRRLGHRDRAVHPRSGGANDRHLPGRRGRGRLPVWARACEHD